VKFQVEKLSGHVSEFGLQGSTLIGKMGRQLCFLVFCSLLLTPGQPYDSLEDLYSPDYGNEVTDTLMPPSFTSAPLHLSVTEGDTVRLPCIVSRLEGFVLLWKRGGRTIALGSQLLDTADPRYSLETEENGSRLVIRGTVRGDGGEFSCQVSAFRPTQLRHSLRVKVRPILETSPRSALTVEEGNPALLSCSLSSGSASQLYWRRANTKVSQGPSFSLSSVLPEDAGRYECVALQEDGEEATTSVDVIVLFAPVVEQEEAYVRRRDGGREVHITCRVKAHPPAHVTWKRDGRRVTGTTSGVVTSSDGEVHTLYLLSGGREAWGRYTCEASNSRGTASRSIDVSAYADEAVLSPSPLSSSPGSLTIAWSARSPSPVTVWRVQFRPLLGGDWGEVDVGATSEGGEVWGGLAQLHGLRPATQYEVKISGRNSEGYSQFSRPVTYATPSQGTVRQPAAMGAASSAGERRISMTSLFPTLLQPLLLVLFATTFH